jgi:hypothetical protein
MMEASGAECIIEVSDERVFYIRSSVVQEDIILSQ